MVKIVNIVFLCVYLNQIFRLTLLKKNIYPFIFTASGVMKLKAYFKIKSLIKCPSKEIVQ